MYPNQLYNSKN